MLISRFVKVQLLVFTVLTLVAALLIVFVYVRVPALLGVGRISATAQLPAAGGLYPNANVTYRGVTVGKVTDVELADGHVVATMSLDAHRLPAASSTAEVHSVSAIGEQYLDLIPPTGDTGPTLADGDVIPLSRTSIPPATADVLESADSLLASVPRDQLRSTVDEFAAAFDGIGPDLGRLLDTTQSLVRTADENYDSTQRLLQDFPQFADPQLVSSDAIRGWSRDLAGFSQALRDNDPALRAVLTEGSAAAGKATDLLKDLSRTTPTLLSTTGVLTRLAEAYHAPIEQVLVVYPMWAAVNQMIVPKDQPGALRFNLETNVNPASCVEGWTPPGEPGGPRNSSELGDLPLPQNSYCTLPQDDPTLARSARNLPCFEPGSPPGRRAATIFQCRGTGFSTAEAGRLTLAPDSPVNGQPAFEPLAALGATSTPAPKPEEMTWPSLMLGGADA
ncbi:MCE family protein [Pseudonocardia sp. WMMC193]|uniref:MCE family protein n=1 Tax=Pseudonocardia sp. WMMC193 TaxID=2911965 RepID=UPI001F48ED28|nr:MCE family protein [Pseudonocardia sp. WMMC193]MCF7549539.1 MCE family protein [Pseudonocardia sp. WMMC193]